MTDPIFDESRNREIHEAAHEELRRAVLAGKLIRQPCEVCNHLVAHAHHEDYSKPLEVRWLCVKHHFQHHRLTLEYGHKTAIELASALTTEILKQALEINSGKMVSFRSREKYNCAQRKLQKKAREKVRIALNKA